MILTSIAFAMELNSAIINANDLEVYKKHPVAIKRNCVLEPMINYNSFFSFETNNNSAFVPYNLTTSYINNEEGDDMLNNVRHKVNVQGNLGSIYRRNSSMELMEYEEVDYDDNDDDFYIPARKVVTVKGKMLAIKRADDKLI